MVRIMDKSDILQHIPFDEYEGSEYNDIKNIHFRGFNRFYEDGCSVLYGYHTYRVRL